MQRPNESYLNLLSQCNHNLDLLRLAGFSQEDIPCLWQLLKNPRPKGGTGGAAAATYLEKQYSNFLPPQIAREIARVSQVISPEDLEKINTHDKIRRRLFRIHMAAADADISRAALDRKRATRIWGCQQGQMILAHLEKDYSIAVPYACRSVSCPVCSRRASAQKFLDAWRTLRGRCHGNWRRLYLREMILTVKNIGRGHLAAALLDLLAAWRRFRQRCSTFRDNVRGCIWTVEITYNSRAKTYHPHIHILYSGKYIKRCDVAGAWSKYCRQRGITADAANSVYIKRPVDWDKAGDAEALKAIKEVTKYVVKPLEANNTPAWAVLEITDAIRGTDPDKPQRLNLKGSWGTLEFRHEKHSPEFVNLGGLSRLLDDKQSEFWQHPELQKEVAEAMSKSPEKLAAVAANYPALYYILIGGNTDGNTEKKQ